MNIKYKAHPWHGISAGDNTPGVVTAFIEIVPSDTVKYEIDKESGYLKIDRPQKFLMPFQHSMVLSLKPTVMKRLLSTHATDRVESL